MVALKFILIFIFTGIVVIICLALAVICLLAMSRENQLPDIDDIDDDDDGILDVDESLVTAGCPNNVELLILLDNSGSISSGEWDELEDFTEDIIDELGASGTVRMAVAHYWSDWDADNAYLYLDNDFTTDTSAVKSFSRRGFGPDELHRSIPLLGNALDGSSRRVLRALSRARTWHPARRRRPGESRASPWRET